MIITCSVVHVNSFRDLNTPRKESIKRLYGTFCSDQGPLLHLEELTFYFCWGLIQQSQEVTDHALTDTDGLGELAERQRG